MALLRAMLLLQYKGAVQEGEEKKEEGYRRRRKRGKKWIRWTWRGIGISLLHTQLQGESERAAWSRCAQV